VHLDSGGLAEKTQAYLRKQFSGLLKIPLQAIDPQTVLEKYGMDSILAMTLTSHLEKTFGPLSKTLFFEYQTIQELAGYFIQSHSARLATLFARTDNGHNQLQTRAQSETRSTSEPAQNRSRRFSRLSGTSVPTTACQSIAIIGLSGRYPEAV